MEWQQIVAFRQLARLGSFTRAAEATLRTQPALSQQIKALEGELDCRLVERLGKRRLRLTDAGERFRRFADGILEQLDRLQEDLDELKGRQTGRLRLAAPFTTLYHLFPPLLTAYLAEHPQVQLTILDRPQAGVIELVRTGEIDFGVALESAVPKDLAALRWLPVETVLLAPVGHPLARARRVSLRSIAEYPLILPPPGLRGAGRRTLEGALRQAGLRYHVVMESSNVELSSLYVEMGLGLSFATMARGLALPGRRLAFISLNHLFKPGHLAVLLRRDKVLAPHQSAFLQLLLSEEDVAPPPSAAQEPRGV